MKFLGRDPPESSLPASDRAPSEGEGETGCAGRTFSIFPEHYRTKHGFVRLAQVLLIILMVAAFHLDLAGVTYRDQSETTLRGSTVTERTNLVLSSLSVRVWLAGCCSSSYLLGKWLAASPTSQDHDRCWRRCWGGRRQLAASPSVSSAPPPSAEQLGSPPRSSTESAASWSAGGMGHWLAQPQGLAMLPPCCAVLPPPSIC